MKAYSPGYLDFFEWGCMYTIDLVKDGQIKGIKTWKIQDLKTAVLLYLAERRKDHGIKNLAKAGARNDDKRALDKWKKQGLIPKTEVIK